MKLRGVIGAAVLALAFVPLASAHQGGGGYVFLPSSFPKVAHALAARIRHNEKKYVGNAAVEASCMGESPGVHDGKHGYHVVLCVAAGGSSRYVFSADARYALTAAGKPYVASQHIYVGLRIR